MGLLAHSGASADTKLKVAYIPIMPMAQLFVMEGEGWTEEAGLDLELTKFSSGSAIVQAITRFVGNTPAPQARDKFRIIPLFAEAGSLNIVDGGGPFPGGAPGLQNR